MKRYFVDAAAYNRWANARLYEAAFRLSDEDYRRDVGAFFRSLCGTLNHLLVADRIWLARLTGEGDAPNQLDAILYEDLRALASARVDEDDRLTRYVDGLSAEDIEGTFDFQTTKGVPHSMRRRDVLAHLFNHQTHHRGQAHTILSLLTGEEPPPLDMLMKQRGLEAPDLRKLVGERG
jgi:uncharacterized damage-inducible protein DinB